MTASHKLVSPVFPQELWVEVEGEDVAWLDGNRSPEDEDSEDAVRDVVELWVRAANLGFFGGPSVSPSACRVDLLARERFTRTRQTWKLQLHAIELGALRVLYNLLAGRRLDRVILRTAAPSSSAPALDPTDVPFVDFGDRALPFTVERDEVVRARRDRAVKLSFARAPLDGTVDAVVAALDLWAEIVTYAGYAPAETPPRRAGAFPDGAILYDEVTIAQSFTEAFVSDEAAFDAVVSYALALSQQGAPVAAVAI